MEQVGGRDRALFQLAKGDVEHRAVGIAVGDIADRDLLRGKVEPTTNPVVGVEGQQPLFQRHALQLFDIAQAADRTEPARVAHCRCCRNKARSRCGVTGSWRIAPATPMASSMAAAIAAPTAFAPPSPAPLRPMGLSGLGASSEMTTSIAGISRTVGIR